jgi:hypothetical protein
MRKAFFFFRKYFLLHRKVDFSTKQQNQYTKIAFFANGGISNKIFVVDVEMINETLSQKFHPCSTFIG